MEGDRENLEPFRKENVGPHMIAQLQALFSAFQLSECPQERKSISAQLRAIPILQTLLSLVESRLLMPSPFFLLSVPATC